MYVIWQVDLVLYVVKDKILACYCCLLFVCMEIYLFGIKNVLPASNGHCTIFDTM